MTSAFENMAKSIVIMKPGILSLKRFDLVILPEHDKAIKFNNVVYIKGAVSRLIDKNNEHIKSLIQHYGLDRDSILHPVIGLFVGGENKYLSFDVEVIKKILNSLKQSIECLGGVLLVSTSRRTSSNIAQLLKEELRDYPKCKMLIIANESNPIGSFEAILDRSDILVISGDSISMISEGINSGKYTLVFRLKRKNAFFLSKHERFIDSLRDDECIYVVSEKNLLSRIQDIWRNSPPKKILNDKDAVLDRLKKIL